MLIYSIETGNFKLDGGAIFGIVPKSIWQKFYFSDENNLCNLSMRSLLIINEKKIILIDCGIGEKLPKEFAKHYFLNGKESLVSSLQKHEIKPEDITDVILTHLHFDHCGGATVFNTKTSCFEPQFKNAKYYVSKSQWESAINPIYIEASSFIKDNFMPIAESGKLSLIEREQYFTDEIKLTLYNGHTSGLMIPEIDYKGQKIIFVGDLIPIAQMVHIPFISAFDLRPIKSAEEKDIFLAKALENHYILFFQHDINIKLAKISKENNKYKPLIVENKF